MTPLDQIRAAIEELRAGVPGDHGEYDPGDWKTRDVVALMNALEIAVKFINGQTFCAGKRHDCPSCNGDYAEDTLADIAAMLKGER